MLSTWYHRWWWSWLPGWRKVYQVSRLPFFPPPFPYGAVWKDITVCHAHSGWELCPPSWRRSIYKRRWNSSAGEVCLFSFVYSVTYYITMDSYLRYTLSYNPNLLFFLAQIFPALPPFSLSASIGSLDTHPSLWSFVCLFVLAPPYFWLYKIRPTHLVYFLS